MQNSSPTKQLACSRPMLLERSLPTKCQAIEQGLEAPAPRRARPRLIALLAVALAPLMLEACAHTPAPAKLQAPHSSIFAPPRNAPAWKSNGSVVAPVFPSELAPASNASASAATSGSSSTETALAGQDVTYVVAPYPNSIAVGPDGNLRPLWILYGLEHGSYKDLTPEGITTRGGLVVSAPNPDVIWLGFGSYRYQIYGAVAVSTNQGRTWTMHATLPGLFRPTPDNLLATSATDAWAIVGQRPDQELVQTTNGGVSWQTIATASDLLGKAAKDCRLRSLGLVRGRLFVGTLCRGDLSPRLIEKSGTSFHAVSFALPSGSPAMKEVTSTITTPPTASHPTATLSILTSQGVTFFELSSELEPSPVLPLELPKGAKVFLGSGNYVLAYGARNAVSIYQARGNHFHGWNLSGLEASALGANAAGNLVLVGSKTGKPAAWISPSPSGPWTNIVFKPPVTASQIPNAGS
jgi:hypothetical protein